VNQLQEDLENVNFLWVFLIHHCSLSLVCNAFWDRSSSIKWEEASLIRAFGHWRRDEDGTGPQGASRSDYSDYTVAVSTAGHFTKDTALQSPVLEVLKCPVVDTVGVFHHPRCPRDPVRETLLFRFSRNVRIVSSCPAELMTSASQQELRGAERSRATPSGAEWAARVYRSCLEETFLSSWTCLKSGLNSLNNDDVHVSDSKCSSGEKLLSCSECVKRCPCQSALKRHENPHRRETVQLLRLSESFYMERSLKESHVNSHGRETVQLLRV